MVGVLLSSDRCRSDGAHGPLKRLPIESFGCSGSARASSEQYEILAA
jgi:hypothetical protein